MKLWALYISNDGVNKTLLFTSKKQAKRKEILLKLYAEDNHEVCYTHIERLGVNKTYVKSEYILSFTRRTL